MESELKDKINKNPPEISKVKKHNGTQNKKKIYNHRLYMTEQSTTEQQTLKDTGEHRGPYLTLICGAG